MPLVVFLFLFLPVSQGHDDFGVGRPDLAVTGVCMEYDMHICQSRSLRRGRACFSPFTWLLLGMTWLPITT